MPKIVLTDKQVAAYIGNPNKDNQVWEDHPSQKYRLREPVKRKCKQCGDEFESDHPSKVYCNPSCRQKRPQPSSGLGNGYSPGSIGALSELAVASRLIVDGYEVFRAVAPNNSFDLVAIKGQEIRRIEVRTGHRKPNGDLTFSVKASDDLADEYGIYVHEEAAVFFIPISR